MQVAKAVIAIVVVLIISGCSTSAIFKIPDGSKLYIYERDQPVKVEADGRVTTSPFFWTAAGGIPYRLEKNSEIIKEGKLQAKFRVVSIFWPPYALLYWPMGLNSHIIYDLVNDSKRTSVSTR